MQVTITTCEYDQTCFTARFEVTSDQAQKALRKLNDGTIPVWQVYATLKEDGQECVETKAGEMVNIKPDSIEVRGQYGHEDPDDHFDGTIDPADWTLDCTLQTAATIRRLLA